MTNVADRWGGIIVAPGYLDPTWFRIGNPSGASHTSNDGAPPPDDDAPAAARFQGRRVAEVVAKLIGLPDLVAADESAPRSDERCFDAAGGTVRCPGRGYRHESGDRRTMPHQNDAEPFRILAIPGSLRRGPTTGG